jgi:DNA-binding XRE family transcriptional regulator
MARKWAELEAKISPKRRARIHQRAEQLLKQLPLEELRSARKLTQTQLAKTMGLNQASISKLERRVDMHVSTLSNLVEAMGGELQITAVFPDGAIRITQFQGTEEPAMRRRAGGDSG